MWNDIVKRLPNYRSAVITGVDVAGYPFSVRCQPRPDASARVLRIEIPECTGIQPGLASLLCHRHDEQFWNQQSFIVWGTLQSDTAGWTFYPRRFTPGAARDVLSLLRFVRNARTSAAQYLQKRHLSRPKIPWNEISALWAEVKQGG